MLCIFNKIQYKWISNKETRGVLKPDLYIHAGFHKTGTTAIQNFLNMNYKALLRQGILYPLQIRKIFGKEDYAHHRLARYFGFGGNKNLIVEVRKMIDSEYEIKDALWNEMNQSGIKSVVISSEVFSEDFTGEKFENFLELFSGFNVFLVYYIRRQDDYVISHFKHAVTLLGHTNSIERMINHKIIDYYKRVCRFSEHVRKENIMVRVYDEIIKGRSVFEDVLSCAGGSLNGSFKYPKPSQSNRSLPNDYVETMRICNAYFDQEELRIIRAKLVKSRSGRNSKEQSSLLSPQQRMQVVRDHHKSNLMVAREFLGRKELFSPEDMKINELLQKHRLSAEGFIDIMSELKKTSIRQQLYSYFGRLIK